VTPEPPGPPHGPDDGTVTSLGPAISDPSLSSSASTPLFGSDRLVRGGLLLLVGNVLTKLSSVTTTVVIVRQLSVTDFGRYSFAFAYGTFFALFADLGLNAIATRNLATAELDDGGRIVGSALAVKGAIVLTCLVGSTAGLLLFRPGLRLAGLVAAVSVANALPGTISLVLVARLRMTFPVLIQVCGAVAILVASIGVLAAHAGVVALVAVQATGTVAASVVLGSIARRRLPGRLYVDRETVGKLVRDATPLALSGLAVVVFRRADQLLLARLASSRELARYAAAVSVVEALNVVPVAVATVALPALAQRHSRLQPRPGGISRISDIGYRILGCFVLPLAALGTVWGRPAMGLLYGPAYRVSGPALAVLLWAAFFGFIGVLLQQVLVARNQLRELAILVVFGAALNVGLNLWAIPRYGGLGAAWASLIAYSVPFVIGSFVGAARGAFRECFRASLRPALAAGAILLVLLTARPLGVIGALLFGVVAPAALLITGSTRVTELRAFARQLAAGRGARDAS